MHMPKRWRQRNRHRRRKPASGPLTPSPAPQETAPGYIWEAKDTPKRRRMRRLEDPNK